MNIIVKADVQLVVPRAHLEAFLQLFKMKTSNEPETSPASRKCGLENAREEFGPNKRANKSASCPFKI